MMKLEKIKMLSLKQNLQSATPRKRLRALQKHKTKVTQQVITQEGDYLKIKESEENA